MSITKIIFGAALLASTSSLPVLAAENVFYAGTNICEKKTHNNNWQVSFDDDGSVRFVVYQQQVGSDRLYRREFEGRDAGDMLQLTQKGHPWASVVLSSDKTTVEGRWNNSNGVADLDCDPFTLDMVSDPRSRFDEILEIYESPEPTIEQAIKATKSDRILPPAQLLSELDQQSYQNRYNSSYGKFWSRFFSAELKRKREAPLDTAEKRQAYIAELRQLTNINFGPEGTLANSGAGKRFAVEVLRVGADRLADTDTPLTPLPLSAEATCPAVVGYGYPGYEELDLISGQPTEYWTRAYAEELLGVAKNCSTEFSGALTSLYPKIEDNQRQVAWVLKERQRLLDVPLELAAFREANWLLLDDDNMRENNVSQEMVNRFIGDALSPRRAEMVKASLLEIRKDIEAKDLIETGFSVINGYCEDKLGKKPWNVEDLEPLFDGCEDQVVAHKDAQGEKIINERLAEVRAMPKGLQGLKDANWFRLEVKVEGWYPSRELEQSYITQVRDPLQEALVVARKEIDDFYLNAVNNVNLDADVQNLCEGVPNDFTELFSACQVGMSNVREARKAVQCDIAVKASGANEELLNAEIEQSGTSVGKVAVKALICGAAERDMKVTFSESGMLWWGEKRFEMGDDKTSIGGKFEMDEESGLLKAVDVTPIRGGDKVGQLPPVDKLFACVIGVATCR